MRIVTLIMLFLLITGCTSPSRSQKPKSDQYIYHKVSEEGQTLASISRRYTGTAEHWRTILDHNPGLDVYRIQVGQSIKIPKYLAESKRSPTYRKTGSPSVYESEPYTSRPVGADLGAIDDPKPQSVPKAAAASGFDRKKTKEEKRAKEDFDDKEIDSEVEPEFEQEIEGDNDIDPETSKKRKQMRDQLLNEMLKDL